ncbi:MAG: fimbrial protein [Rhodanobacter sp.]
MNKTLVSTALVAVMAAIGFAPTAQAAGGTINITGKVLADTCVVAVNGGATVVLPVVMTSSLNTVGAVAGATSFNIGLTGCDTNTTSATMAFSGSNINSTTGNLNNTASGGSNVQVQLLNGASVVNTSNNTNAPVIAVSAGTGSTTMKAQYIAATAAATAGLVSSSVNFTLTYL